jgi:hypothetical protein
MAHSIFDKIILALQQAAKHNSSIMVSPEVILWPDPEKQWLPVIPILQEVLHELLVFGDYNPQTKQGPAIWLKCVVGGTIKLEGWPNNKVPIIYLPGIAKHQLRNVEDVPFAIQPLLEYQYTGTLFLQENGREWSILAFVENPAQGLGAKVAKDTATKEALKKTLSSTFQDKNIFSRKNLIEANDLNNHLFPDIIPTILKWMCKGDAYLTNMENGKREAFLSLCKTQYGFLPDHKNIKAIAEKLGMQQDDWKYIWQFYASAPHKYPEVEQWLRLAKPDDMGKGFFSVPDSSWPQVNEQSEAMLAEELLKLSDANLPEAIDILTELEKEHSIRRSWVWAELGKAPLVNALFHLYIMARLANDPFPSNTIEALQTYYVNTGFKIDQHMRKAYATVRSEKDKSAVAAVIKCCYSPWLDNITAKFQSLLVNDHSIFNTQSINDNSEPFILFVDALRFELASDFQDRLESFDYKTTLNSSWSAIPSLTATAKPAVSPIASSVNTSSSINEFRPQLSNGKDLLTNAFREALKAKGYTPVNSVSQIESHNKYWFEIGNIDTRGHEEQANMVKRIDELFEQLLETIEGVFAKGFQQIKIVTDHGWLLLPNGLPKTQLNAGLTETRWGRCALIKEGVKTNLLHLPWRWNPATYIAYAPGISFFKANMEYAHGGISLHECLVPIMYIQNTAISTVNAKIASVKWVNLKCTVNTLDVPDGFFLSIRTKYSNPASSILEPANLSQKEIHNNKCVLMVSEEFEFQAATIVLMDKNGRILDKKNTTVAE